MKKLLALVLILMMALPTFALAGSYTYSTESYGFLRVDNCKEWISLRKEPSTRSERLLKIPLGAMVTVLSVDVTDQGRNGFDRVMYSGETGYVLRKYLFDRDDKYDIPMYAVNCKDYVSLREFADTNSKRLEKIRPSDEVTVMCYGFTYNNEPPYMARARFTNDRGIVREGFVNGDYISVLPEDGSVKIQSARLHINRSDGELFVQTVSDRKTLDELEQMILGAKAGITGQCPNGAVLELTLSNGRTLYFTYPVDGCGTLIAQNACIYNLEPKEADRFWEIFDQAYAYAL